MQLESPPNTPVTAILRKQVKGGYQNRFGGKWETNSGKPQNLKNNFVQLIRKKTTFLISIFLVFMQCFFPTLFKVILFEQTENNKQK